MKKIYKNKFLYLGLVVMLILGFGFFKYKSFNNNVLKGNKIMDRLEVSNSKYRELFKVDPDPAKELDPELMAILRRFIFADVFHSGVIDDKLREIITVITLAVQQTLPQLKSHINAALNIDVRPIEIREAIYQCAPFIGFPKTLNAVNVMNEVFRERGIVLPLENQGTIKDEERYKKGKEIQEPLYGNEIQDKFKNLSGEFKNIVPEFLTEFGFGDFYTRNVLDIKIRELLILVVLTTLGAEEQIKPHAIANIKLGNDKEKITAVLVHCIPYVGFPSVLNALNIVKDI